LEEKIGSLQALPIPPPASVRAESEAELPTVVRDEDAASIIGSMRDAAARHAEEIMEIVRLEREQMDREREAAALERERLFAEAREERARLEEEREERVRALEAELAQVKADLENERALRISEEAERRERERMENLERDEAVRNQLGDITNLVQEQRDECARKKELNDERWEDKMNRRAQKDNQLTGLYDMINKIVEDREADKIRMEEERLAAEAKPGAQVSTWFVRFTHFLQGMDKVIEELARQNAEQRELLDLMAESTLCIAEHHYIVAKFTLTGWRNDAVRNRDEIMKAIRETAHEQVPFNVQGVGRCISWSWLESQFRFYSTSMSSANLWQQRFACC
jgi:hypothetical protein